MEKLNLVTIISKIRNTFKDENLYFTFVTYNNDLKQEGVATFGSDNMDKLHGWMLLMEAKFASGSIHVMCIVIRRFLKGDKNIVEVIRRNII
jgi:hypothetical protein